MPQSLNTPPVHSDALWTIERGVSPIVATAVHNRHSVRNELEGLYALSSDERLREEDPFMEFTTRDVPNRIVFHRSRFEVDINRGRDGAIYLAPEQAWGLKVWKDELSSDRFKASLSARSGYSRGWSRRNCSNVFKTLQTSGKLCSV